MTSEYNYTNDIDDSEVNDSDFIAPQVFLHTKQKKRSFY